MTSPGEVIFLFDVDNTPLDNDRVQDDLRSHLEGEFGAESRDRYWAILEEGLRAELGYTDYLGALQRYRPEDLCDPRLLMMSSFLVDYPFANRVYPGSPDALEQVRSWGPTVILSDGDAVFLRQGQYALDYKNIVAYPPADLTIEHIGALINYPRTAFLGTAAV